MTINQGVGWGLLALVALIVASAYLPSFTFDSPQPGSITPLLDYKVWGAPWYLIPIALFAVWAGWYWGPRRKIEALVALTFLLFFVMHAYEGRMLENLFTLILLYLTAIAVAGLVYEAFKESSWRQLIAPALLVAAIFAFLGFSQVYTWEELKTKFGFDDTKPPSVERNIDRSVSRARLASNTTVQCPGGIIEKTFHDANHRERISEHPCQVLTFIEKGYCVRLYGKEGDYQGSSCTGGYTPINGITYQVGGDDSGPVTVLITLCPLGKVSKAMGSCS